MEKPSLKEELQNQLMETVSALIDAGETPYSIKQLVDEVSGQKKEYEKRTEAEAIQRDLFEYIKTHRTQVAPDMLFLDRAESEGEGERYKEYWASLATGSFGIDPESSGGADFRILYKGSDGNVWRAVFDLDELVINNQRFSTFGQIRRILKEHSPFIMVENDDLNRILYTAILYGEEIKEKSANEIQAETYNRLVKKFDI